MWAPTDENADGLKLSLLSSTVLGDPITSVNACFVLTNRNPLSEELGTPPGPPAFGEIQFRNDTGSMLELYDLTGAAGQDVGGVSVLCEVLPGGTVGRLTPAPVGGDVGEMPADSITNKCCFDVEVPGAGAQLASSTSCPHYSSCYPGTNGELLTNVCSGSGCSGGVSNIFVWSLGGPGCGLIGLEMLIVPFVARLRRRGVRWRGGRR